MNKLNDKESLKTKYQWFILVYQSAVKRLNHRVRKDLRKVTQSTFLAVFLAL